MAGQTVGGAAGPGTMRVSDAERARVADALARAHGEGRLTLAEYDERVRSAHGAVVRDDLTPLLTDLPEPARPSAEAPERSGGRPLRGGPGFAGPFPFPVTPGLPVPLGGLRGAAAAWALVSAVNVAIWLAVVLGSGAFVYPWWIWVAGPWGMALLVGALGRRAEQRRVSSPSSERSAPSLTEKQREGRSLRGDVATSGPSGSPRRGGSSRR